MINLNLTTVKDPDLKDLLDLYQKQILLGFNCHHVATVQSFDSAAQTITATVNYKRTRFEITSTGQYVSFLEDYPLIADCPVVTLNGNKSWLNMPIAQGDQCILMFNDRDLDNWHAGSSSSPNATPRLHAYGDAIALVGPNSQSTVLAYDAVRVMLTNGTAKNGINPSNNKLVLTNGTSLNDLLQQLCTKLESLCTKIQAITVMPGTFNIPAIGVVVGISGMPINSADFAMLSTDISSIATNIGSLIE